jgi:hypothetical protein
MGHLRKPESALANPAGAHDIARTSYITEGAVVAQMPVRTAQIIDFSAARQRRTPAPAAPQAQQMAGIPMIVAWMPMMFWPYWTPGMNTLPALPS